VNTAKTPYPLYPGIRCIHRLCGASSLADLPGSAASLVRRQRQRVVLLAIGPVNKMSAKSSPVTMAVWIHPSAAALGRLSRRDVALLLREVKRDYLSQHR
jgi:hypothetical protein